MRVLYHIALLSFLLLPLPVYVAPSFDTNIRRFLPDGFEVERLLLLFALLYTGFILGVVCDRLSIRSERRRQTPDPPPPKTTNSQSGSVFTVLLAAVAMASALSIVLYQTISGPMSSMVRVTNKTVARAQLQSVSNIVIMDALNQASSGDCDGDGSVEPREWRDPPVASAAPGGGGLIPLSIGAPVSDPWGTDYGYCVWDVGTNIKAAGCGGGAAKRLSGTASPQGGNAVTQTVIAIVSAGPNRQFQTSCRDYVDTTTDTIFPTGTPASSGAGGDDVVQRFTYTEAASATSSIWTLKVGDAATAEINKDISVGPTATPKFTVSSSSGDISTVGGISTATSIIASANIAAGNQGSIGSTTLDTYKFRVLTGIADDGLSVQATQTAGNTVSANILGNLTAGAGTLNPIIQSGDMGLIYKGTTIDSLKGFVIAPWSATSSGLRMDNLGNVTIPGNLTVTGTLSGTFSVAYPTGAIPFGTGSGSTTDDTNFFWDDTNNRLGIGTAVPAYKLDVVGNAKILNATATALTVETNNSGCCGYAIYGLNSTPTANANGAAILGHSSGASGAPGLKGTSTNGRGGWFESASAGSDALFAQNTSVANLPQVRLGANTTGIVVSATSGNYTGIDSNAGGSGTQGLGVLGRAYGTGVRGIVFGDNGTAVDGSTAVVVGPKAIAGTASGVNNTGYAGYFTNNSATGWGVYSAGTSPSYFAGNVGIGMVPQSVYGGVFATPQATISQSDASATSLATTPNTIGPLVLVNPNTSNLNTTGVLFATNMNPAGSGGASAVGVGAGVGAQFINHSTGATSNYPQADLFFLTHPNGSTGGPAEAMRITGAGNVGIGTTTPLASLQVARGTGVNGTAAFEGTAWISHFNFSGSEDTYIRGGKAGSVVHINDSNIGNVLLAEGGGNVGIGTTAPAAPLTVQGQNAGGIVIDASTNTGAVRLPQGTTAQRPTCTAGTSGAFRYNTTKFLPEFCDGTGWVFMSIVVPDFNFIDHPSAALSSTITSNTVTLGNFATAVASCNAGCTAISINGGAFVAGPVTVHGGDTIAIRQTSSASNNTATTATVTIDNTISGVWTVTTIQAQNIQTFNASGTWNKPPGNYNPTATTLVQCWGAGAGGAGSVQDATFAGSGGGGGGGSINTTVLLSTLGSSQAVVIGTGGTGGNPGPTSGTATRGTVGSDTTFAGMTAGGGGIGTTATGTASPGTGGAGGTAGTGGAAGSNGSNGFNDSTGNGICPGAGRGGNGGNAAAAGGTAGGVGGQGGAGLPIVDVIAYPGTAPGGGGGGGAGFNTCGPPPGIAGAGAAGRCIITTTDVAQ